ncbi:hypothetical protein B0H14DRAFT_2610951 [Mycena olivaceomarginata]|nr:hypothetical protein B0H14DRAFT_2610951 [Mycena olivaceomarginata]
MLHLISLRFDFSLVLPAASLAPFPLHNAGENLAVLSIHCINRSLTSSARLKGVASKPFAHLASPSCEISVADAITGQKEDASSGISLEEAGQPQNLNTTLHFHHLSHASISHPDGSVEGCNNDSNSDDARQIKSKVIHLDFENEPSLELNPVESDTSELIQSERAWFQLSKPWSRERIGLAKVNVIENEKDHSGFKASIKVYFEPGKVLSARNIVDSNWL